MSGGGGGAPFWASHSEVRDILISILGHSGPSLYGFGASRVPIARLAEPPVTRTPAALRPPQGEERSDQIGGAGGYARSSSTKTVCGGKPGSRRPPGGRVAA